MEHGDATRLAPTHAELERAIASVPGVVSASVDLASATGRSRLRLRLAPGEDAESVSWSVAATLRERFGIALDPEAIRPRQTDHVDDATDEGGDVDAPPDADIEAASDPIRPVAAAEPDAAPRSTAEVEPSDDADEDEFNPLSGLKPVPPLWPRSELAASRDRLSDAAREALDGLHASFASSRPPSADTRARGVVPPRGADALFGGGPVDVPPPVDDDLTVEASTTEEPPVVDGSSPVDAGGALPVDAGGALLVDAEGPTLVDAGGPTLVDAEPDGSAEPDEVATEASEPVEAAAPDADPSTSDAPAAGRAALVDAAALLAEALADDLAPPDEVPVAEPEVAEAAVAELEPVEPEPAISEPRSAAARHGSRDPRAVIRHLDTHKDHRDVRIRATLEHDGRSVHGEARSLPTSLGILRAVAEATVDALRGLTEDHALLVGVDRISVQPAGEPALATVVLTLLSDRGEETLLGSSIVRGDPERAVMRATLDALNRRVAGMLTPVDRAV